MIVNTETGEIIEHVDFYPLRRKPRGRVSRPKRSQAEIYGIELGQSIRAVVDFMSGLIIGLTAKR